jgi:hypothetical protein
MRSSSNNPTIARLDRKAAQLGLVVRETGKATREFDGFNRTFHYRPGGLGIVRVTAYVDGKPDTIAHRTVSQMEDLFARVIRFNEENQS